MTFNSEVENIKNLIHKNSIKDLTIWFDDLEDRKKDEIILHDKLRDMDFRKSASKEDIKKYFSNTKILNAFNKDGKSLYLNNQFWFDSEYLKKNSISGLSDIYFNNRIAQIANDSVVLDMACGFGRESIIAAKNNAKLVVGIDLSSRSIEEADQLAKANNVNNAIFTVADCENLFFKDKTFDYVICARMLHHIKFEKVMQEVSRVLKDNGKIICIEALGINPIINIYRQMTPAQRTDWEKSNILTFKHIKIAKKYFYVENMRFWHLLSPLAKFLKYILPLTNFLDKYLLTKIPILNRLSWTFSFELKKK